MNMQHEQTIEEREVNVQVAVMTRGALDLGFPLERVVHVCRVTPYPISWPMSVVVGVVHINGKALPLLDVGPLICPGPYTDAEGQLLVAVVSHAGREFAIQIDDLVGVDTLYHDECVDLSGTKWSPLVSVNRRTGIVLVSAELFNLPDVRTAHLALEAELAAC